MLDGPLSRIALFSIAISLVVLALKVVAWWLTGSIALYSDALESLVNVAAAITAFIAVRLAEQPADLKHPYGHHKAEYISAGFEGALIILAALAVLRAAWLAFLEPRPLEAPGLGLAVNAAASVLNGGWGALLILVGRRRNSPALVADGWHLLSDVVSSVGVLAGLIFAVLSGLDVLDPLLAAAVGVYILWAGWQLLRDSVGGLMDEATTPEVANRIRDVIAKNADGALEVHDLRTRRAGRATFAEFHLVVSGAMSVSDAHAICDRLEEALRAAIDGIIVTIHVEPEHKAKMHGSMVLK